jgi:hypothetical protein
MLAQAEQADEEHRQDGGAEQQPGRKAARLESVVHEEARVGRALRIHNQLADEVEGYPQGGLSNRFQLSIHYKSSVELLDAECPARSIHSWGGTGCCFWSIRPGR